MTAQDRTKKHQVTAPAAASGRVSSTSLGRSSQVQTPRSDAGAEFVQVAEERQAAYERNNLFTRERDAVLSQLKRAAGLDARSLVRFLRWVSLETLFRGNVDAELTRYPKALRPIFEQYVAFALRFRVYLRARLFADGSVVFTNIFQEVGPQFAKARLSGLHFAPLTAEFPLDENSQDEEDYRDNIAVQQSDIPKELLVGRSIRVMHLIDRGLTSAKSGLRFLLDTAYDPLCITAVIVETQIGKAVRQPYLLCLVGELIDDETWKKHGKLRTNLMKYAHGESPRGRPRTAAAKQLASAIPGEGPTPKDLLIDSAYDGVTPLVPDTELDRIIRRTDQMGRRIRATRKKLSLHFS